MNDMTVNDVFRKLRDVGNHYKLEITRVDAQQMADVLEQHLAAQPNGGAADPAEQTGGDGAACGRCGASSEAEASTRCIPDGDSCPGCDEPVASAWSDAAELISSICELNTADPDHPDTVCVNVESLATEIQRAFAPRNAVPDGWQPIETAPRSRRQMILLLTPSGWPQVAWSNTWWTSGFSVENKPTHWMPIPAAPSAGRMGVDRG